MMTMSNDGKIVFRSPNYLRYCSKLVMGKTHYEYNDPLASNFNH
jgi:hypothetical protein